MWIRGVVVLLFVHATIAQDVVEKSENKSIVGKNIATNNTIIQKEITQPEEIRKAQQINNSSTITEPEKKQIDEVSTKETYTAILQSSEEVDFKYYWFLLVGSSMAILGLIVFKSFRMRRSRKEVKYGKASASDEIEPLGSSSKWDDDSSSENEDEIFDINFLKNTRLQKHSDA